MNKGQNALNRFIEELRNRRVFRVAAVYAGVAFAGLEAGDIIVPMVGLPDWTMRIFLLAILAGFPVAIALAWIYQVTPEGIRRSPAEGEKQNSEHKPLTSNLVIVLLLVIISGLVIYPRITGTEFLSGLGGDSGLDANSIAVLPFTPFGDDREDEIFADGVHDDILTQLSKIAGLKVISRTSVMQYKRTTKPIPEIAAELGVVNILEGSVRRAGDQVRIVAQLINANTDEHLWADSYDREMADIFTVQSEVAKQIASALKVTLTSDEINYIDERPTGNLEAYGYYLRGRQYFDEYTGILTEEYLLDDALELYEKAVAMDPNFILAYANLVEIRSLMLNFGFGIAEEHRTAARRALDRLKGLAPDHPQTDKARGLYAYYVEYAYDDALEAFNKALSRTPNDDEVMLYCAAVKRRQGLWQESRTLFSQASQLNPRSTNLLYNASMTSIYLREWAEAAAYLESIVALEPDAGFWRGELAFINLDLTGDLESVAADLERVAGEFPAADLMEHQWYLAVFLRDFEKADSLLSHDRPSSFYPTYLYHALTKEYLGQHETARLYYDSLLTAANENLSDSPDEISTYYNKGQALIGLGRVEEGLDAVRMAVDLVPIEKDAMNGVQALQNLMESYARAEMPDETLDLMEQLLSTPSYLSVAFLRYDPVYDFLRDEPRFKAILKADTKVSS